jgi:hypothetical protein
MVGLPECWSGNWTLREGDDKSPHLVVNRIDQGGRVSLPLLGRSRSRPLGTLYLDEGDLAEDKEGCSLLLLLVARRIGNKIGGLVFFLSHSLLTSFGKTAVFLM